MWRGCAMSVADLDFTDTPVVVSQRDRDLGRRNGYDPEWGSRYQKGRPTGAGTRSMSPERPVIVVDDDPYVRRGLKRLIAAKGYPVRTFSSGSELMEDQGTAEAGCLVLDLNMPGQTGLELQSELARRGIRVPVVFLSGYGTVPSSVLAMKEGAVDFLEKPVPADELVAAIERALHHGAKQRQHHERIGRLEARLASLTPREREVFERVVSGRLNKQIALALDVTEGTVKVHRSRVMSKMGAGSLAHLVRMAEQLGISTAG